MLCPKTGNLLVAFLQSESEEITTSNIHLDSIKIFSERIPTKIELSKPQHISIEKSVSNKCRQGPPKREPTVLLKKNNHWKLYARRRPPWFLRPELGAFWFGFWWQSWKLEAIDEVEAFGGGQLESQLGNETIFVFVVQKGRVGYLRQKKTLLLLLLLLLLLSLLLLLLWSSSMFVSERIIDHLIRTWPNQPLLLWYPTQAPRLPTFRAWIPCFVWP